MCFVLCVSSFVKSIIRLDNQKRLCVAKSTKSFHAQTNAARHPDPAAPSGRLRLSGDTGPGDADGGLRSRMRAASAGGRRIAHADYQPVAHPSALRSLCGLRLSGAFTLGSGLWKERLTACCSGRRCRHTGVGASDRAGESSRHP